MCKKSVFISHAVKDKEISDALVDLLINAMDVPRKKIFSSTTKGTEIKFGKDFIEFILSKLEESDAVILLLSPHYFESTFCQCELGAAWALSKEIFPFIIPPLEYEDIKAVLIDRQQIKIQDESNLSQFRDELLNILEIQDSSTPRFEAKRNEFIEKITKIINKESKPSKISYEKFEKIQKSYKESVDELTEAYKKITGLENRISKLKECTDREEYYNIITEDSDENEQLELIIKECNNALNELPDIIREVFFNYFSRDEGLILDGHMDNFYKIRDAEEAVDKDFLNQLENVFTLNEHDPKIKTALNSLEMLDDFLNSLSEEFYNAYEATNELRPVITSKRFWEKHNLL